MIAQKLAALSHFRALPVWRLMHGAVAQGYNHVVTTVLQFVTVPLLLYWWGAEGYGIWITLSALPTYLTLADLGFGTIAGYEMGMAVGAGNRSSALEIFQSVMMLVAALGLLVLAVVVVLVFTVPFATIFKIDAVSLTTARAVLLILSAHIVISSVFNVICGGMRATGKFSLSIYLTGTSRLLEQLAVILVASLNGGLVLASVGMLAVRVIFVFAAAAIFASLVPWMRFGLANANLGTIRRLFWPAVTYMFYTLGNLLNIQGVSLVVAALFGPATVANFSAMRTLARLGPTASSIVSNALEPEYSFAYGAGQMERYRMLIKLQLILVAILCAFYGAGMLSLSHWIFHVWTADQLRPIEPLMTFMVVACLGEMIWTSGQTPLVSTSKHQASLSIYLVASAASIAAMVVVGKEFGIDAIGAVSIAVTLLMVVVTALGFAKNSK